MTFPTDLLTRIGSALATLAILLAIGFGWGYHVRGTRQTKAEQKQEVKVAKVEATDEANVKGQNDDDAGKIAALEQQVADLRARPPATRTVRVRDAGGDLCSTKGDAGSGAISSADGEPSDGGGSGILTVRIEDYEALRQRALSLAANGERARIAWASCQAQWPTR